MHEMTVKAGHSNQVFQSGSETLEELIIDYPCSSNIINLLPTVPLKKLFKFKLDEFAICQMYIRS